MSCLCLAAFQPFTRDQMPHSADGLLQLYRSVALEHSLRVDHPLWPRFSSGLVYGYGAPLFNYFPPLAYFPASLATSLGLSFLRGWLLSMSLYTVLAGVGMFLLGRLWTGSALGGWMAATAYVYSPYLLFDSVARGATAELAALAVLPFAFYGLTRLALFGRGRDGLIALASLSLFMPLHTIITLHGAALLTLYSLFLVWRADNRRSVLTRLLLIGALALMLTSFYWLPALTERDAIKLPLIAERLEHIDAARHLRPLSQVLALPPSADPTQQNQALPITLGWAQLCLAVSGALLSWRGSHRRHRSITLALWLTLGFLIFLNTPASAWLWRNLPLIGYTQFPWRTLGLASLLLALLAAIGGRLLWLRLGGGWLAVITVGIMALAIPLTALPWTYALYRADIDPADIGDAQQYERDGGQLALSSYAEYLPVSADAAQLDADRLIERFEGSDVIPRLMPSATLDILAAEWGGASANLRLRSGVAQKLIFDWLYLPGWSAAMDGAGVAVYPSAAGLVALDAPAGQFDLRLALKPTAAQSLAHGLSGLGVAGAILLLLFPRRMGFAAAGSTAIGGSDWRWTLAFAALGIALFVLKTSLLDAADTPIKRLRFGSAQAAAATASFDGKIDLLAFEAPALEINAATVKFTLYWRLHEGRLERDYASVLRMRDPQGLAVAEAGSFAPGGLATSNWLPGAYIEDVITLRLPPFTPRLPEPYAFDVGLYDVESLAGLSVINAAGDPEDLKFEIARLPLRGSTVDVRPPPASLPTSADDLALLYDAPTLPTEATAGDSLRFSWVWKKLRQSASNPLAQVIWLDSAGEEAAASDPLPLVKGYDFADWSLREINRGHHRLIAPPRLPAGRYGLSLRLVDAAGQAVQSLIPLERTISLSAPQRSFDAPEVDMAADAEWNNGISLHGYSIGADGEIELVWGAKKRLKESLRLFVHALDADGRIAAQWDGVPVEWTRHTTGWIQGEYVTTRHSFALPAGDYRLRVGWYAPSSGERVKIGQADQLPLETPLVTD